MGFEAFTFEEMQELLREKGVAKQYWLRDQVSRHTHDEAESLA